MNAESGTKVKGRRYSKLSVHALALILLGCVAKPPNSPFELSLDELRREAQEPSSADVVGHWLLAELISPSGKAKQAAKARKQLDAAKADSMAAHLARGMDDAFHGRLDSAPDHFLNAARWARLSEDPRAPLIAWYAVTQAVSLSDGASELYARWKSWIETALARPENLGWRARMVLVDWWGREAWRRAIPKVEEQSAKKYGCVREVRLAGPFGRNLAFDRFRSFAAEEAGTWPTTWPAQRGQPRPPRVLKTDRFGCDFSADEAVSAGIFYAETFVEVEHPTRALIAAEGAIAIWLNDHVILERDIRTWGIWPKYGVEVALEPGRHRLLVKLPDPTTSITISAPDGTPLALKADADPAPGYSLLPPTDTSDPNVLMRFIGKSKVMPPKDDVTRFIVAYLAHLEDQDDVASVLMEPIVKDLAHATGPSLARSATFVEGDPIFDAAKTKDLVRELHERALKRDPNLWESHFHAVAHLADSRGLAEAVPQLKALAERFPQVSTIGVALQGAYESLGWAVEARATQLRLLEQFPNELQVLHGAVDLFENEGKFKQADGLLARIKRLDPDSEVTLMRALEREDWDTAVAELKRMQERRPDNKDLEQRILSVLERAGEHQESLKLLKAAIQQDPKSGTARLALADAHYAKGKPSALANAIADAMQAGADPEPLKEALDLVEGMTELEPYRLAAEPIIAAYEAAGKHMPGTAARVLDYSAIWIKADGSSRTLSHEVIRIQSAEAINQFAEHRRLGGLVLHMRVIKADGRTLEPEIVPGKPTVTFPHLEVGDYIETEHVVSSQGDGVGAQYSGPRWFFREENVAYARSEFVVISPEQVKLDVETRGDVPPPDVSKTPVSTVRRWRVDFSPAAPDEPMSAPVSEFLPSVTVGWGIDLDDNLERLAANVVDTTPKDPRIIRIAKRIAQDAPSNSIEARARSLYRWVLANVEEGEETDGRRAIIGKRGNRWRALLTLCDALDIEVHYAVAKNRLASPPVGPMSRASMYSVPILRVDTGSGRVWLTVNNKYAPFGYIPAETRGMPAYILEPTKPKRVSLPEAGSLDSLVYAGKARLDRSGAAKVELSQSFVGKYAIGLRRAISELPENRLHDVIESRLLGRILHGARLSSYEIINRDKLDEPLTVEMHGEVPDFAQARGEQLVLSPPFVPQLARLASLATRETPLLIGEANHQVVDLQIELPKGARVRLEKPRVFNNEDRKVTIKDTAQDNVLHLQRDISIPPGRVAPEAYSDFAGFVRKADASLSREIAIQLR